MFYIVLFFFKQKTAYEMRISDWSSDVCSSDLLVGPSCRGRASPCAMCGAGPCGPRQGAFTLAATRRARQCLALGTGMGSNISDSGGHSGYPCPGMGGTEIGRASCRERVWKYV